MLIAQAARRSLPGLSLKAAASARCYSVATDAPIPRSTKIWDSVDEAVKDVKSGDTLLCGGAHILSHCIVALSNSRSCRFWVSWDSR